jgi:hypothetical protein
MQYFFRFRIVYITQLWKDSKDIEFVKQTIGHRNLDTTSAYIKELSDQERQDCISRAFKLPLSGYLKAREGLLIA